MVPFAIRIFKEIQLNPGFTRHLEDPIQSIPRLWNQPFWVGKQYGFIFVHKDEVAIRLAGVSILWTTPHHSYYCHGTTFRWIRSDRSTMIIMYLLALAWWHHSDVISIAKCQRITICCGIARRCRIAQCRGIVKDRWLAKSWSIANYRGIAKDRWLAKRCWIGNVLIASNLLIANNIANTSWFGGGSFNRTRGSKLVPFNGLI